MADHRPGIRYSIVVPVFNEEAVLPMLLRRLGLLMEQLDGSAETIFVDDGSSDCSPIVLQSLVRCDPRYRYIGLSRNFGHQVAITAGMDAAAGEAIIVMDADLQDPPEIVGEMIAKWKEGFDVVYARRLSRAGESRLQARNREFVLQAAWANVFDRNSGGCRRLSPDRPQGAGRVAPHAGAGSLYKGHDRVAGLSANRSDVSSIAKAGRRNQVSAVKDGPPGGERRTQLFRCPIAACDLVRVERVSVRGAVRLLRGKPLVHEQPSR